MCQEQRVKPLVETVEVIENREVSPDVYFLRVRATGVAPHICSGQFVHLRINGGDVLLRRPLSVCQTTADELHIYYAVIGKGTEALTQKCVGDTSMDAIGPLGSHWPDEGISAPLLIGGGLGMAPLGKLAHMFRDRGVAATLIQGSQTKERLIARDVHEHVTRDITYATDDGTHGYHGFVTDLVQEAIAHKQFDAAYICGPEPMQKVVSGLARKAGITTYVSFERRMACGVGACLGCVIPTTEGQKRVCVDGPVFNAEEVLWDDAISSRIH